MRIPSSVFAIGRGALALAVLAGSIVLVSGAARNENFSRREKAHYADPALIQFVQPGLAFKIVSAKIGSDGTISVDYKVTDQSNPANPLDLTGVATPGAISPRYLIAYIPKGQTQFVDYVTTTSSGSVRAGSDSGGTLQTVALGEYIYTFGTKVPAGFDATATHRVAVYGSRNLTQWDMGTYYADTYKDFVPNGSAVTVTRDVAATASCNKCHDQLAFHGGSRQSVGVCVICHTPVMKDATGFNPDFKVMIHKIHMGSQLPSVVAGGKYALGTTDWSTVTLPSDPRRCTFCHDSAVATQANNFYAAPSRDACGACHDDVNFATGQNHGNIVVSDDTKCTTCHVAKAGPVPFDNSVPGAHEIPDEAPGVPGLKFTMVKVTNGAAGQKPTVTFTVKDNNGNGVPMSVFSANSGSLSLTMSGPTTDYGATSFGADVTTTPGYVTESVIKSAQCGSDGTCTYTFTHAVPASATGTFVVGIEGRLSTTLLPGTSDATTVSYSGINQVIYFSVDGSPVAPRRTVVALANCNNCHARLELHGSLRNNVEYCVICHNPMNTDFTTRPNSKVAADKSLPNQAINLALMVHKIHTGVNLASFKQTYVIVGYGGSHNDFSDVRYPAMSPTGAPHDTTNCAMCHANGSEGVFPEGKNAVVDPQGLLNPSPATTSACTACHLKTSTFAHAVSQTDPKFGESCSTCHATGQAFDVDQMHAGK